MRSDISIMRIDVSGSYYASVAGSRKLDAVDADLGQCMAIKHDCSVRILGWKRVPLVGHDGWRYVIAMEALHGIMASDLLTSINGLPVDRIIRFASSITDLLRLYHSQDLLHRCTCPSQNTAIDTNLAGSHYCRSRAVAVGC